MNQTEQNSNIIDSWGKYKNWVNNVVTQKKDFFYRGQMDYKWSLQTTLHRIAADLNLTLLQYLDTIIPETHYYICAFHNELIDLKVPEEFGSFLALLQHHGFPTPLLDWTLSPYIASYFAYKDIDDRYPQCKYVKIFIFDYLQWIDTFQQPLDLRNTSVKYVSVIRPHAKYNPRIIPQRGTYTVTNVSDMAQYILECSQNAKKTFLYSVNLPVSERPQVMRELNLMGINEMTLFPGLDGLCKSLKEQFFSRDNVGPNLDQIKQLLEFYKNKGQK